MRPRRHDFAQEAKTMAKKAPTKTARTARKRPINRSIPAPAGNGRISQLAGEAAVAGGGGGGGGGATSDSLEKVRDILFGSQQRDNDRRFSILEEQVAQ